MAYVVELHDEDNRALISRPDVDIVMSAEVVSHLLAQVAMQRSLAWIYEELFTRGGSELRLREVVSLGLPTVGRSFQMCQQVCLIHNSIAVGVVRQDGVIVQPSSSEPIRDDDHLVVVEWE